MRTESHAHRAARIHAHTHTATQGTPAHRHNGTQPRADGGLGGRLLAAVHECEYVIEWRTAEACAKSGSGSGGSGGSGSGGSGGSGSGDSGGGASVGLIVFLVLLSMVLVYVVVGTLYNRYARGATGLEQLPHYDICQASYYFCVGCLVRAPCRARVRMPDPPLTTMPSAAAAVVRRRRHSALIGVRVRACTKAPPMDSLSLSLSRSSVSLSPVSLGMRVAPTVPPPL
jgi:hypothetical protein